MIATAHVVHPSFGEDPVIDITPASAGWSHLSFAVRTLAAGDAMRDADASHERCLVVLSGDVVFEVAGVKHTVEGRESVFSGLPHAMYLPPGSDCNVTAERTAVIGIGKAPARGGFAPRFITPADVTVELRGGHNALRQISHLIDPGQAERLLCVEVYTPSGNWSSYPSHRHDEDDFPRMTYLEETYYMRLNPGQGFGIQRVYTEDGSLNETMTVKSHDVVLVPKGYHPCAAIHGYDLYYLNVMAGPTRTWKFHNALEHEWLMKA